MEMRLWRPRPAQLHPFAFPRASQLSRVLSLLQSANKVKTQEKGLNKMAKKKFL